MKRRTFIQGSTAALTAGTAYLFASQGKSLIPSPEVQFIMLGGFLGAGKTTLLWEGARVLMQQGYSVGFITNDQSENVVDTHFLKEQNALVEEVAGGCFCCRFDTLEDAISQLRSQGAQIILAEPVGSCTDLSATVAQPIKRYLPEISLAPYTVLADPTRVLEAYAHESTDLLSNVLYILRKQLEEADLVLLTKSDSTTAVLRTQAKTVLQNALPDVPVFDVSAVNGSGVREWMDYVRHGERGGQRITSVDYDRYADGEAALGWLNALVSLGADVPGLPDTYMATFVDALKQSMKARGAEVGHVKAMLATAGGAMLGNLTHSNGSITVRRVGEQTQSNSGSMVLNARAQASPESLEASMHEALGVMGSEGISQRITSLDRFSPARPVPTYRESEVI